MGIEFFRDMKQFFEAGSDMILLCTSIIPLPEVLNSIPIGLLNIRVLVADVLSVKEFPRELLLHVLPDECDALCTQLMFGPESVKGGWSGMPLMFEKVRIRNEILCMDFLGVFEKKGCRMLEMSCKEHDKLAARSQFLTHTIGRVLSEMEIESTPMDTKGFQTLLQLRDRISNNSFDLYCGLFIHNKFAIHELENLEHVLQAIKTKLLERMETK